MKKTASLLVFFAVSLMAANVWQKPWTEWSDKDVNKVLTDSPWVKSASISMSFPGGDQAQLSARGGGGGGRGGGPQGDGGGFGGGPSLQIVAHFDSALPVRQALVKRKFGAEAEKSADAQKVLSEEPKSYEIVLSGPMGMYVMGPPDAVKQRLIEATSLSAKSGTIKPTDVQVSKPGRQMDVLFVFPRDKPFTVDDQEVDFTTKLGTNNLKYKFKLKDMVVNGKLEM